jgi:IS1 family transposase
MVQEVSTNLEEEVGMQDKDRLIEEFNKDRLIEEENQRLRHRISELRDQMYHVSRLLKNLGKDMEKAVRDEH